MSQDLRRKLLKGLAVTLPAAWTAPIVESIILPAHAQTSPVGCSAPAGCYAFELGPDDFLNFEWPGGSGPEDVDLVEGDDCIGEPTTGTDVVVAESPEAAQAALNCDGSGDVIEIQTEPALGNGCSFYRCDTPF